MKRARGFAKSRTGCQSCKDRKIKCDETKPECEACLRSGIRCPGYVRPLRWSRKHEMHSAASTTSPNSAKSHSSGQGESGIALTHETHPDFLSASLIEASCTMPAWLDLSLDGNDPESAFQDATDLLSHDFSGTPPLLFPDDALLPQNFDPNSGHVPSSTRDLALAACPPPGDTRKDSQGSDNDNTDNTVQRFGPPATSQPSSNGPRALLHTFYRLSSPNSVRRLSDEDFVRHYFKHVCKLVSCFDSNLNPFRSLAEKWYKDCPTVSYTIQSMAVAHIANWYPYMAQLCVKKRNQAWRSLQKDLQLQGQQMFDLDKALLCLFLLGISASWQPISSLGLQYLHIARTLIQSKLRLPSAGKEADDLNDFWAGALVHWEMLASFVDPVPIAAFDGHGIPELSPQPLEGAVMPHPWTGIVNELQFVLAEVGRVARRRQQLDINNDRVPLTELDTPWLRNLEQLLLSARVPDDTVVADYQDSMTSNMHLIRTAQAYRQFGLMEIYRLNPDLLQDQINSNSKSDQLPFSFSDGPSGYIREIDPFLAAMATQTLDLIADIPLSSGACRMHPLLLVACASQLHFPDAIDTGADLDFDERHNDITQNRYLVEARMFALSRKGPQGPILKAINIVKEVWDRLDNGHYGNWIDVMHEKGWQAILA